MSGSPSSRAGPPDADATFAHVAFASPFDRHEILRLGAAEGWVTRISNRGPFACVEIWLEDRLLVEVLDPAMQRDHANGMTARNGRAMFGLG